MRIELKEVTEIKVYVHLIDGTKIHLSSHYPSSDEKRYSPTQEEILDQLDYLVDGINLHNFNGKIEADLLKSFDERGESMTRFLNTIKIPPVFNEDFEKYIKYVAETGNIITGKRKREILNIITCCR
jgi:hypothetical protein